MKFELKILGSGASIPTEERKSTSHILNVNDKLYLIDCAEGTQMQMKKYKVKFQKIDHIFISHVHGDHYLGLNGLMSTMRLLGRTKPLHVYGPPELKEIIDIHLKHSHTELSYPFEFHPLQQGKSDLILNDDNVSVTTFPLNHRIPCWGFIISEKRKLRNLIPEKIEEYSIPKFERQKIKEGANFIMDDGRHIPNEELTTPPKKPNTYAFCSDTKYTEEIVPMIEGADILYHEATFLHDMKENAKERFHSTSKQAAKIAKLAGVGKLIIGHFSTRYRDLQPFLDECCEVFQNTYLAKDGEIFTCNENK